MFKVFTTAEVIDRMVDSYGSHACPWLDVLELQGEVFYAGRNEDWMEDPEDPWFIISQRGHDFINCEEYINAIPEHPDRVLEHPDAAFLLNVDDDFARGVERSYGVVCQPVSKLDCLCRVAEDDSAWNLRKEKSPAGKDDCERKCWKDLLGKEAQKCPSNALIVVDRNFFSEENKRTHELVCIEGLMDYLDVVLPKDLKCEYQVLIVFEEGKHPFDSCESEQDFVDRKEEYMNELFEGLRDFPIKIELLSVSRYKSDYNHNQLFLETHNRRLVSNYYYIGADFSLAPFYKGTGPRAKQRIWREYMFSNYWKRSFQDLAFQEMVDVQNLVGGFLLEDDRLHTCNGHIENRLVKYGRRSLLRSVTA